MGVGGWAAGGGLYLPIGLPRSASHSHRPIEGLTDVSLTQGLISDPYLPSSTLHGPCCLSCDFTCLAKPALEKQTS